MKFKLFGMKRGEFKIHYLNTVFKCINSITGNHDYLTGSEIIYYDDDGNELTMIVLTDGMNTYFSKHGLMNLLDINHFPVIRDEVKDTLTQCSYIHFDSIINHIKTIKEKHPGYFASYEKEIKMLYNIKIINRNDMNNTFECMVRNIVMHDSIGGYSEWKKLK